MSKVPPPDFSGVSGAIAQRLLAAMDAHPRLNTQNALALESGVGQATISKITRGSVEASVSTMLALAQALGVPLAALLPQGPGHETSATTTGELPLSPRDAQRLSPVRRAFLDTAARVALRGRVSEVECLDHMREWAMRLEASPPPLKDRK